MGRELRRVPLDFSWPLNKVWEGFRNLHWKACPAQATGECHNGYSCAGKWLDAICRFIAIIGENAVEEPSAEGIKKRGVFFPHPYIQNWDLAPKQSLSKHLDKPKTRYDLNNYKPPLVPFTEELVEFVTRLAGQRPDPPFGGMLDYRIRLALLRAAGYSESKDFGVCEVCGGSSLDPAAREVYEAWKQTPPPEGEGWQVWETVSEGSPISPVFATRGALIDWLVSQGYGLEAATAFTTIGWAPTMLITGNQVYRDVDCCTLAGETSNEPGSEGKLTETGG